MMNNEIENDDSDSDDASEGSLSHAELRSRILAHVNSEKYRPSKPRMIVDQLGLEQSELVNVRRTIKRMVRDNQIRFGAKHLVLPLRKAEAESRPSKPAGVPEVKRKSNEVVGVYRKTSRDFGFVTPSDYFGNDRLQDVFIPPRKELDAVDGDTVRVRLNRELNPQRQSGQVIEVVERRTHRFVGTYWQRGYQGMVTVDAEAFANPISVGDATAKNCRPSDKVVIEMVHFPKANLNGEAVIVEVLGARGQPGVDTQSVIVEFGLPGEFPVAAMNEAHRQAELFDETKLDGRTDFTRKTIVTIDPRTARDFDDAISLEQMENGNWELGVHIADVAHFVRRGTALDDEAFVRGNSVYLPDKVIPMLPEVISNNLASLQPGRVRYTMSVLMEVTPDAEVLHAEWHRGAIKSAHRFNYQEIDEYLADEQPWREKLSPEVFQLVRNMHDLAMPMRKRRMARGAIDLALPEVNIDLDDQGQVAGAHVELYTESHQLIEEFMLAANEAVAQKLFDLELFYLRRIHEAPSEKKLRDLTEFVRHLGIPCESLQSRFEIKRVLHLALAMQEKHAVHFAVLRSMQKAIYSPKEVGHYALGSTQYCHFTSPIRRYPDLIIHRMVADLIDGKKPISDFGKLERWGRHCSDTEQRAEQAERELIKLKLLNYLSGKIGMVLDGFVTGVEAFGVFVQGTELPAEGLIPLESLPPDQYLFDGVTRTLQGRRGGNEFRLGDRLSVEVAKVDVDRRVLQFQLARKSESTDSTRSARTTDPRENNPRETKGGNSVRTPKRAPGSAAAKPARRSVRSERTAERGRSEQGRSEQGRSEQGRSEQGRSKSERPEKRSSEREQFQRDQAKRSGKKDVRPAPKSGGGTRKPSGPSSSTRRSKKKR